MIKFYKHRLKSKTGKYYYSTYCLHIYRLKLELIVFGKKRCYRAEWSDWCEE
jgi:hypothetical protein